MNLFTIILSGLVLLLAVRLATIGPAAQISPIAYVMPGEGLPPLAINQRLQTSVEKHFEGEITSPEHIIFKDGYVYFGVADGRIVRTKQAADGTLSPLETIVYTGNPALVDRDHPCGTPESEGICGRALGMQFDKNGKLIVADCYLGLLEVDVNTKTKTVLLDTVDGLPLYFTNSVAIGPKSGKIYFTDSTTRWRRRDFIYEVLESQPTGRVIVYDPNTKQARTLVDQIAFANGILIDKDETYLLIVELGRSQLLRYSLTQPPTNEIIHWDQRRDQDDAIMSVFIDNLPGIPDNIQWESNNRTDSLFIGCGGKRTQPFSLTDFLAPYPTVRKVLAWAIPKMWFLKAVPTTGLILRVRVLSGKSILNPLGLTMGQILETLQDPSGKIHLLTGAYQTDGWLYLGSISHNIHYLPRLRWTQQNVTDETWRFKE